MAVHGGQDKGSVPIVDNINLLLGEPHDPVEVTGLAERHERRRIVAHHIVLAAVYPVASIFLRGFDKLCEEGALSLKGPLRPLQLFGVIIERGEPLIVFGIILFEPGGLNTR